MPARIRFHLPSPARAPRLALAALALAVAAGCTDDGSIVDPSADHSESTGPRQFTFYGAAEKLGNGTARSYFTTENGVAVEVGIALSEGVMRGLPTGDHATGSHTHDDHVVLRMHSQNPTPYRLMDVNWNPAGHPPAPYAEPHFDFHFYTIGPEERNAISPADPQWAQKANHAPAPEYIPANYVPAGAPGTPLVDLAVPRMGVHWVDATSPELSEGKRFTETFIYGSWDGKVIFAEPMVTRAFLESRPSFRRTLPTAQKGYNPGSYRVYWNERTREYRVALADLPAQR